MNKDSSHEIIISEIRYAGMLYIVFVYDNNNKTIKKLLIEGRSWD